ncbi:hypothetical protein HPB49_026333 [Dermacentor silvarum]|nr:hypothetical protein HPB49_026333 [Dermacentor silvarum]
MRRGGDEDEMHANQKDYFLVHRTCLVTLLNQCRTCSSPSCTVNLFYTGTRITARTECPHAHVHTWSSEPLVGNKPRGNIYLTTALLFSGSSPTSALRMMRLMDVQVMSDQAFFNYQKAYLLPAVTMVWDEHQETLLTELRDTSLQLCGDGHSAKFLTYSFLCPEKGKIVHTEQVQVKEHSSCISLGRILGRRINEFASNFSSYTVYQCCYYTYEPYGIRKKLATASRRAGCNAILAWTEAIINHLYWCACACGGNGDMLVAAWRSMLNHVRDFMKDMVTCITAVSTDNPTACNGSLLELLKNVLELCAVYETFPKAFARVEESVPPVFSSQADRTVTKGDLVAAHKARFLKF